MPDEAVFRLRLVCDVQGHIQSNVFHLSGMGVFDDPDQLRFVAARLQEMFWLPNVYGSDPPGKWVGRHVSMVETTARVILAGISARFLRLPPIGSGLVAGGDHDPLPPNSTISMEWLTARAGRHGHGRSFLVGLDTSVLNSGDTSRIDRPIGSLITNSYRDMIKAWHDCTSPPGQFVLCVYHRDGFTDSEGTFYRTTPIVDCRLVDDGMDSQRQRLPGHVHH